MILQYTSNSYMYIYVHVPTCILYIHVCTCMWKLVSNCSQSLPSLTKSLAILHLPFSLFFFLFLLLSLSLRPFPPSTILSLSNHNYNVCLPLSSPPLSPSPLSPLFAPRPNGSLPANHFCCPWRCELPLLLYRGDQASGRGLQTGLAKSDAVSRGYCDLSDWFAPL